MGLPLAATAELFTGRFRLAKRASGDKVPRFIHKPAFALLHAKLNDKIAPAIRKIHAALLHSMPEPTIKQKTGEQLSVQPVNKNAQQPIKSFY